jgi:hypothetical protein
VFGAIGTFPYCCIPGGTTPRTPPMSAAPHNRQLAVASAGTWPVAGALSSRTAWDGRAR